MFKKNIIIDGNYVCRNYYDIIESKFFKKLLSDFFKLNKNNEKIELILKNIKGSNKIEEVRLLFSLLIQFPLTQKKIYEKNDFSFILKNKYSLKYFTMKLYDYWRSHNRFLIKSQPYSFDKNARVINKHEFCELNENLKLTILNLFRQILQNLNLDINKVYRQITASAECSLLTCLVENPVNKTYPELSEVESVWFASLQHPVIYYTTQNKRTGLVNLTEKNLLVESKKNDFKNFFCVPLLVGNYFIHVYVHRDFLHLGASLTNLMEIADFELLSKKPDGMVIFGLPEKLFNGNHSGSVYQDKNLNIPVGCVPYTEKVDYFGYMKKMILTVHNTICIKKGVLPVHGSFAKISLKTGETMSIMLVGDSGAGKSETLEALNKVRNKIKGLSVFIDDMGSVEFEKAACVAYGTEIGAFVRLDDLDPGYAYNTMDRAIFINPHTMNARVIVPFADYFEISAPHRIDAILNVNNYDEVKKGDSVINIFSKPIDGYKIFESGKRMAKGTTGEVGMTESYFSNPFGAVQFKDEHDKIANAFFNKFKRYGVIVGEIKTQLGLEDKTKDGPLLAAKGLLDLIKKFGGK